MFMNDFFNNDTIALLFIGVVAIVGVVLKDATTTATAIGALGGFLGAKGLERF
jgi:hypothetical protein